MIVSATATASGWHGGVPLDHLGGPLGEALAELEGLEHLDIAPEPHQVVGGRLDVLELQGDRDPPVGVRFGRQLLSALGQARALQVVARGFDMHGEPVTIEGSDYLARAIQHETDHLDGILFVERLDRETKRAAMKAIRESDWFGAPPTIKQSPHATRGLAL